MKIEVTQATQFGTSSQVHECAGFEYKPTGSGLFVLSLNDEDGEILELIALCLSVKRLPDEEAPKRVVTSVASSSHGDQEATEADRDLEQQRRSDIDELAPRG